MILYLGRSDLISDFEIPMPGPGLTVWLREEKGSAPVLECTEGPVPHLATHATGTDSWHIYGLEGAGEWFAGFIDGRGEPRAACITISERDGAWSFQVTEQED